MRAGGDLAACTGVSESCEFHVAREHFVVHMNDGDVQIQQGAPTEHPDALVRCEAIAFMALGLGLSVSDALEGGWVSVEGDPEVLRRCFEVLRFPDYPAMNDRLAQMGALS
jgi:hypothetical protein